MPRLHFFRDDNELFVHVLRGGRTLIGRSDRCDIALPSDAISRTHCIVDSRSDGHWLVDRSRHGTPVDGQTARETLLADGATLTIGPWTARFVETHDDTLRAPTATLPLVNLAHEEMLEARDQGFVATRAQIVFDEGPRTGEQLPLERTKTSLGGGDSAVFLDDHLPSRAAWVRVVRGRPMVEPGQAATYLAGVRVREVTPVLEGEPVRIGDHVLRIEPITVEEQGRELEGFGEMVGRSTPMRKLFGVLHRMAAHDAPVLLTGESGTGKELAARGLHEAGPRAEAPFVALNCAAVQENLFESELFGHVKGAFTGADRQADGAFQRADGGTLFLDEIGEMRLDLQAKLLRALESGEVRRVGGREPTYPDVRVVAATNRHLPEMCRKGTFRQDLYYRLEVLTVRLPPLRERRDDIPAIARTLLARNHPGARISDDALDALVQYDWPGNIRELRNVLTRAYVMSGAVIGRGDLTFNPWAFEGDKKSSALPDPTHFEDDEREAVRNALRDAGGNRTAAARALGIPRSSLLYRMKRLKIVYPS